MTHDGSLPQLEAARDSMKAEHVPRYEHECPTHGWETCGIAASLVDPLGDLVWHGCSTAPCSLNPIIGKWKIREVPA